MKFFLNSENNVPARLGYFLQSETGKQFNTPLLVQTTKAGSIPYLSKEVFDYITKNEQILHISLATTDHMEEALTVYNKGISSYVGYPSFPSFLSIKDSCEIAPSGYHEKDIIPIFTRKGKIQLSVEKYMNCVEKFKPNMYHTLCDSDTNFESSKKRITKSVERTEKFFRKSLILHKNSNILNKLFLFAPIVGGFSKEARIRSIKTISHSDIDGYMLDGFHKYGTDATIVNNDALKEIVSYCLKEINCNDKPRMILGAFHPLLAIELVNLGIDVFDSSYVYLISYNNKALTFKYDLEDKSENTNFCISLDEEKYREDFKPLLENCECLACKKHTRAYLHHLIKTKELLSPILFVIHNTHHYMKYFDSIRKAISKNELQKLIELIKSQSDVNANYFEKSSSNRNCNSNVMKYEKLCKKEGVELMDS